MSNRRPILRTLVFLAMFAVVLAPARARADGDHVPNVLVLDAEALGVAPESAAAVTRQLYATVARLGYLTVPETTARQASGQPHAGARTPADLLQAALSTQADHAVSATLGALGDRYAVTITLANADRTGPGTQTTVTDAASLESAVDTMTRALLPPAPAPPRSGPAAETPQEPKRTEPKQKAVHRLSIDTEGAVGLTSGVNESTSTKRPTFYNQYVGPRFDFGFPNDFALGAFVGYANLTGKEGRAQNVLSYLQLQYRTRVSKSSDFRIPLRFASGYLPKNGPFIRLAAGIDIPLGRGVHLGFDLVAPALWVIRNRAVLSLDWGAEVGFDL
jgi:hypothetical protein